MRVQRDIATPVREGLKTAELWLGDDRGLVACWERGRVLAQEQPGLAEQAVAGELVVLPWKGGVEKKLKGTASKVGTYRYLAMWQGLRGENLDLDTDQEITVVCAKHQQPVLFTDDPNKYAAATD